MKDATMLVGKPIVSKERRVVAGVPLIGGHTYQQLILHDDWCPQLLAVDNACECEPDVRVFHLCCPNEPALS